MTDDLQAEIAETIWNSTAEDVDPVAIAAAVMAVLRDPGNRERVLTEIGMEQVWWMIPRNADSPDAGILHDLSDVTHLLHDECVPVYAPLPVTGGNEEAK